MTDSYFQYITNILHRDNWENVYEDRQVSYLMVYTIKYDKISDIFHDISLGDNLRKIVYQYPSGYMLRTIDRNKATTHVIDSSANVDIVTCYWKTFLINIIGKSLIVPIKHDNVDGVIEEFYQDSHILDIAAINKDPVYMSFNIKISFCLIYPWIPIIFAHIIMIDPNLRYILSYIESKVPITAKEKEVLYMMLSSNIDNKITVTMNNHDGELFVRFFKVRTRRDACIATEIFEKLIDRYNESFMEIIQLYSIQHIFNKKKRQSKGAANPLMVMLRNRVPDLFISGYSRECPNLPLLIDNLEDALILQNNGKLVIQYPLNTGYYYTSSKEGYYVGLKENRMNNRAKYKYLINCYMDNHENKPHSHLYNYIHGIDNKMRHIKTVLTLPNNFKNFTTLQRIQVHNFDEYIYKNNILAIFSPKNNFSDICIPQLARQECFRNTNKDILEMLKMGNKIDLVKLYRCFEYIFEINIIMLKMDTNNYASVVIPEHCHKYIWKCRYDRSIFVIQRLTNTYGVNDIVYDIITDNETGYIFDNNDTFAKYILDEKKRLTTPDTFDINYDLIEEQYIDPMGKCMLIKLTNGEYIPHNTAPLPIPCNDTYNFLGNIMDDIEEGFKLQYINKTEYRHLTNPDTVIKEKYYTKETTKTSRNVHTEQLKKFM